VTPHAMEEHYQAYFAWKARGYKEQWCWHVDAHLDIGKTDLDESKLERLKDCPDAQTARAAGLMGNSYLPWGGLHCGNYLLPAIHEGIVNRLTWVIPPDLPEGALLSWAKRHINSWYGLELSEYASLELEGDRVVGRLLGIPFEMGTLENLTLPTEPVLMDIDIDYFLTEHGEVWQDSQEFAELIHSVPVLYQTVAYSVMGGFTPTSERRLAAPFIQGETDGYEATALDHLAGLVRCHKYQEAIDLELKVDQENRIEVGFLKGLSYQAIDQVDEALEVWAELLGFEELPPGGKAYLHGISAEIHNANKRPVEALEHTVCAQKLEPTNHNHYWNEAVAREQNGEWRRTQKVLRKVIKLSEHLLFGLGARHALSRVYKHQGKDGLANMELKKLAQLDVTGHYRPATMLAK
jgi:tetratricopeptide (TPR) repeat protein